MTDKEVRICMSLLFNGALIQTIQKDIYANAVNVRFKLMSDIDNREYSVDLLLDCIEQLSEGVKVKPDGLYMYQQFTIAKSYSEYWTDNIFVQLE